MENYADDDDAEVPFDRGKDDRERCCEGALTIERRENTLLLGSLIFDALNSPYPLINMLRMVITLLTAWRALFPGESPWYVFKNYCGDGDDEDDEAELSPEQTRLTRGMSTPKFQSGRGRRGCVSILMERGN